MQQVFQKEGYPWEIVPFPFFVDLSGMAYYTGFNAEITIQEPGVRM
jgi:hypothetical protein